MYWILINQSIHFKNQIYDQQKNIYYIFVKPLENLTILCASRIQQQQPNLFLIITFSV